MTSAQYRRKRTRVRSCRYISHSGNSWPLGLLDGSGGRFWGAELRTAITNDFIKYAKSRFRLDWSGIHGAPHWSRVRHNGLLLAKRYKADTEVIQWFAFMHDLERHDDHADPDHGARAAQLARELNDDFMRLSDTQLDLLQAACTHHSDDFTDHDITVMICWDADRLDLGRVGIYPDEQYLCTALARTEEFIDAAYDRSVNSIKRFW